MGRKAFERGIINFHAPLCGAPPRHESRLLRTPCSRNRRRYSYFGLSPYILIPACPSDVCMSVRAGTPIHTVAVRGFHRVNCISKKTLCQTTDGLGCCQQPEIFILAVRAAGYFMISSGNLTRIRVPFPRALSTSIFASWILAACFTMESPNPVPPTSLE